MEDKRRILEMVREGVLTPEEALELLSVLGERDSAGGPQLGANLEGDGLLGLDLALSGGNLEAGFFLRDGEHRLEVRAGNAELRFLPGSDLEVEAQVRLGGLEVAGPWRQVAAPGGRRWSLGEGKAKLRARVAMGNLELEA